MIENVKPISNMIYIKPGTFNMGSPITEVGRNSLNEDLHQVTLTKEYFIGKYPVTQKIYNEILGGEIINQSKYGDNIPITRLSWDAIHARNGFIEALNIREHELKNIPNYWSYKLPSEAQWECACRAGSSNSLYNNSELDSTTTPSPTEANSPQPNLNKIAWYDYNNKNSLNLLKSGPRAVGQKKPNALGIYDMLGNVWEWCSDAYIDKLGFDSVIDPICSNLSELRTLRGGCWYYPAAFSRCASRGTCYSRTGYYSFGFRIVLSHD